MTNHQHPLIDELQLTDDQLAELGDLDALSGKLQAYHVPEPDTPQLLATLHAKRATSRIQDAPAWTPPQQTSREWLRLMRSQWTLLDPVWWWSCIIVLLLGIVLIVLDDMQSAFALYSFGAPVLAALSTAYLLRPATKTMLELEQTSPLHITDLMYARLCLVLGFNIVISLALLIMGWNPGTQVIIWRLLLVWLGPMIGLSGMALYVSLRWNPLIGAMLPLALWGMLLFAGWHEASQVISIGLTEQLLYAINQSDYLLGLAIIALLVGIICIGQSGNQVQHRLNL